MKARGQEKQETRMQNGVRKKRSAKQHGGRKKGLQDTL